MIVSREKKKKTEHLPGSRTGRQWSGVEKTQSLQRAEAGPASGPCGSALRGCSPRPRFPSTGNLICSLHTFLLKYHCCTVWLVSPIQKVTQLHIYSVPYFFYCGLSWDIEYSFPHRTVGPCCSSIYTRWFTSAHPSLPAPLPHAACSLRVFVS